MRRNVLLAVAVCAVAVGIRLHALWHLPPEVWGGSENERVAAALARGRGWCDAFAAGTGPTAHVAPLYPLLLSGIYRLCGTYQTPAGRLAQASLAIAGSTLVVLLLPLLARSLGLSVGAGWAAAFVAAWLPANLCNEATGSHEQIVATLALFGLVAVCLRLQHENWSGRRALGTAALVVAVVTLLAPNFLLVPALFFLAEGWWRSGERRRILRCGLTLLAVVLVTVLPWLVRNYVVLGGLVPLRSNLGLELAAGNRPDADGYTYTAGFHEMHPFYSAAERARLVRVGELAYMKDKQREALGWIAARPGGFAWLTLRRAFLFWFTPDERWYTLDFRLRLSARVYGLLGLAMLAELLRLLRRGHPAGRLLACTLLGVGLPYFVTHVEMRYRLPIVGLSALLACNLAAVIGRRLFTRLRPPVPVPETDLPAPARAA
jgi:hypothetical protein